MSISRKFITVLVASILFIAFINIASFYFFYNSYLKIYLAEKIQARDKVTIEYINEVIERQTLEEIDNIFSDIEIEFFELLENNQWSINLNDAQNIDIVTNYLIKSWVAPKYIEEIIPQNKFAAVLDSIKQKGTPEYNFLNKFILSVLVANIIAIVLILIAIFIFAGKTIIPIKNATKKIKTLKVGRDFEDIEYKNKKDEIGLLIGSINELNHKLVLQDKIKNKLLADISHELKTPITSIQCYLEWIMDWVIELNDKTLSSITEEMKRLIKLVNMIMEYEKFENKNLDINLKKVNIQKILIEISETSKQKLKKSKQRIKVSWEDIIKEIDEDLFRQIVHNIIGNFVKYAGKNTHLQVNVTRNYIDFSDDGKGVSAKEIPFLLEKFYQGKTEKTWDIDERGIGVGLSVVEKIVNNFWWTMKVESDTNKGFRIKINF
jgi:signal transduction histidine kinase